MTLAVLGGASFGTASIGVPWFPEDTVESFPRGAAEVGLLRLEVLCQVVVSANALLGPLLKWLMFGASGAAVQRGVRSFVRDALDPLVEADTAVASWEGASASGSPMTY
jgi:hypothetical protein